MAKKKKSTSTSKKNPKVAENRKPVKVAPARIVKETEEPEHEEKESKKVVNTDEQKKITNASDAQPVDEQEDQSVKQGNKNHEELKDGEIGKEDVENIPDQEEDVY